ncbi:MAG TPA: RIP metalloprotease RseP [Thermodesulfobacteriota bacterium]|nr:RIP metalloprotease RseP [Thermodesulfobacteriota bacterium]
MTFLVTFIIPFLIVLGVLIFVHEFGHFIVAKLLGVRVEKFSLGFGPRLLGITRGDTEYRISLLPLGGYVKLAGEEPGEALRHDRTEFSSRSVRDRAKIVLAGPLMNMILPFLLFPLVFMLGTEVPAYLKEAPIVGWIEPHSAAETAGIQRGDRIAEVNGRPVNNWGELENLVATNPKSTMEIGVVRGSQRLEKQLAPEQDEKYGIGYAGLLRQIDPVVGYLSPGYPAEKAGLQVGDRIVEIAGVPVYHWNQVSQLLEQHGDKTVTVVVLRRNQTLSVPLEPRVEETNGQRRPVIGISLITKTITEQYGPIQALVKGTKKVFEVTGLTLYVLKKLVSAQLSVKTLGGPIMIAQATSQAAASGAANLLFFIAFLSINLAIINIIPIPILDGGHLLFLSIEAIRGKPIEVKKMEIAQQVGMAALLLLMVIVTYNDIQRLLPEDLMRFLPWK